jgi:hypothetical protein
VASISLSTGESAGEAGEEDVAGEGAAGASEGELPYDEAAYEGTDNQGQESWTKEAVETILGDRVGSGGLKLVDRDNADFEGEVDGEMVDFDAMGAKGAAEHWDEQEENFLKQIVIHVTKMGRTGFVPIDLRGFGAGEIETVKNFVMETNELDAAQKEALRG